MTFKLYPPGVRNERSWVIRGYVNGRQHEVSCRTMDQEKAEQFAKEYETIVDEHAPKRRTLGPFERWLLQNYRYVDGEVRCFTGEVVRFHKMPSGYRNAKVWYGNVQKTVLEHRVVFLLVHRWLPESIDHIDGDRAHNNPENLRAATPLQQARNKGKARGMAVRKRLKMPISGVFIDV